jgi:DNA-binding HxlR family transcriptional regulator
MRNSAKCRSHCPINFVLETLGDKWTLLIVRDLMFKGKKTYGEFLQSAEGISTNILVERLKRLEKHGIVVKCKAEDKRSTLYRLTEKGKDLLPAMLELTAWSAKYDSLSNTPPQFVTSLRKGRSELIESVLSNLE